MKIVATWYDAVTGAVIDRRETDLRTFVGDNPNEPPQYVIREEIRDIGAYITQHHGIRCEVTKR